tara:strand:- start:545 stop:730 length:186 start_codon:yes stop_codon:yes gene_type:complete
MDKTKTLKSQGIHPTELKGSRYYGMSMKEYREYFRKSQEEWDNRSDEQKRKDMLEVLNAVC